MTEGTNSGSYCGNCGSSLSSADRFCGVCGSVVSPLAGEDAQVLPKSETTYQGFRPNHNRSVLIAGLAFTLFVLSIGITAYALSRNTPTSETAKNDSPPPSDSGQADDSSGSPPVTTVREETVQEETETTSDSSSGTSAPTTEEEARQAVEDYYEAVNDDDWAYTYAHRDSRTQAAFTEEEWARRNQWFETTNSTTSVPVSVDLDETTLSSEQPVADVERELIIDSTEYSEIRDASFVYEDGMWVAQYPAEGMPLYMPDASFEEFVEANSG